MDWRDSGRDIAFLLEFRRDGELVIPDTNSVHVTIRDATGSIFPGYDDLLVNTTGSVATLPITAIVNTLPDGVLASARFIEVSFTHQGAPIQHNYYYTLKPFTPIGASPADVRGVYGVRESELPDSDIDIYGAYLELVTAAPGIALLLTDVTGLARKANRAIVLKAALMVFPSMRIRTLKEEEFASANQIRATIEWEAIHQQLVDELNEILEYQLDLGETVAASAIFMVVTPTDVVTNA